MSEIIYDATRNKLESFLSYLKKLEDSGINVSILPDEVFQKLEKTIMENDAKKLARLRKELNRES